MKCFIAILLLALVAIAMAAEKTSEAGKIPQPTDGRDKRGLGYYSSYAYAPYGYNSYGYNLPYTYSPYVHTYSPYGYNRYHYNTPYHYY